jgi:Endoribonuclease L-PSP
LSFFKPVWQNDNPNHRYLTHTSSLQGMAEKQYYSTGTKWEPIVGYSRAIRVGNLIFVTGTTAWDESGEVVGAGDAYAQTVQVIRNIERALAALGAGLKDVVRTRTRRIFWEDQTLRHHGRGKPSD